MSDLLRRDRQQRIENEINNNIDYSGRANITFKENFSFHMQVLPKGGAIGTGLIDRDMFQDLTQTQILNWCRTADCLFPVLTKSDGNCLCHAVSTALWGISDDHLTLRNLICVSIDSGQNKERWRFHYENQASQINRESLRLNENDWDKEWKHVIDTAMSTTRASSVTAVPHAHLEAIHIFSLASILRRPIIVLADSTARTLSGTSLQESDIGGIYLPLNWPPGECHKHPIVLGYTMSHFCPLLPQEITDKSLFTVPIVTRDGSFLPIRFLTNDEEKRAANLLKTYLKIKEVAFSSSDTVELVLCTEIKSLPLPNTSNVFSTITHENTTPNISAAGLASSNFNTVPCITQGCKFFGSPATGNMCSNCLSRYLSQQAQQSSSAEPSAPPPSMPLSEQFYDVSMMGETCTNGCGYRCSTQTYPYCHECAERQRAVSQGQTAGITESSLFGVGSVTQEKRLDSTESRRCRGEGCDREGKSYLGSLCDKCFMDDKRKKQICSTPGCTGIRVNSSYCFACQNAPTAGGFDPSVFPVSGANMIAVGKDQQATGLPEKEEESETRGHESSSSLIESGTRCNAETPKQVILTGPEDKIQCASPMCNALIYPPHKLCQRCIDILMQSQATSSHQQQQQQLLEPTVVSLKENDITQTWGPSAGRSNTSPIAVRSHMMRVQLSETTRPSSAPIGRKCLTPDCTRFGDPSTSDLCTSCYSKTVGSPRSLSVGSANIDNFTAMMTRIEGQKRFARHCKAAECTNYGNPSNEGFCNSCYPRYMMMKQGLL